MNRRNNGRSAGMTRQTAPPWLLVALFLLLQGGGAWSQSVRLAQIDASRLLTRQATDLYVAVTDEEGNSIEGLSSGQFEILESTDGQQFTPAPITDFDANPHATGGVTFLLLVDNSGSMYDTIEGEPTEDPSEQRIAAARGAIREFLDSIDNPLDRVGLASFNTYYRRHREPAHSTEAVESALEEIEEPTREEAFTELYRAISLAAEDLAAVPGRTVLVVLSDGENYPFATYREAPHPTYEQEVVEAEAALEALQREGIGAFAVNFATAGDPQLVEIVNESGGLLYDAETGDELAGVYEEIRRRVLDEYRITYRPSLAPGPPGSTLPAPFSGCRRRTSAGSTSFRFWVRFLGRCFSGSFALGTAEPTRISRFSTPGAERRRCSHSPRRRPSSGRATARTSPWLNRRICGSSTRRFSTMTRRERTRWLVTPR
ncbi:MAG: vWA domain-containing protein [Spirochaetaceae bacterium]